MKVGLKRVFFLSCFVTLAYRTNLWEFVSSPHYSGVVNFENLRNICLSTHHNHYCLLSA